MQPASSGSLWLTITNVGVLRNGTNADVTTDIICSASVPQTAEAFNYDAYGNMTDDVRWAVSWDLAHEITLPEPNRHAPGVENHAMHFDKGVDISRAKENRGTSFSRRSAIPGPNLSIASESDYMGRRIGKFVTEGLAITTSRFVYDGWNVIAILDDGNNPVYSFNWGADASGTIQGAGGVGGLISMTVHSGTNAGTYFYAYDGNFNVVALVNAADGTVVAQYEYSPFGKVRRTTGPMAQVNPFLFSTAVRDAETDFSNYGHKYLAPGLGMLLGRDPAEEDASPNLCGLADADPIDGFDVLGLVAATITVSYQGHGSVETGPGATYISIDRAPGMGQVPLNIGASAPAATINALLDDSFSASISAITTRGALTPSKDLQLSSFLQGTITACCPCPYTKVTALFTLTAAATGSSSAKANSKFESREIIARPRNPSQSASGWTQKSLSTANYCANFSFNIGQAWYHDALSAASVTSTVSVTASFTCAE